MDGHKQVVPMIVGPTAIGKTAVALEIGRLIPITVISADSRQVYRRLDIGTAKPTSTELRTVPHHGLNIVDPGEHYSAGRFASDAAGWIRSVPDTRQAIVVGGTGFYVRALAEGLFHEPPMNNEKRAKLREWALTADGLSRWAARLDPGFVGGGKQRSARVVEVALLTGKPLSWWHDKANQMSPVIPWYVRLTSPRAVLHQRINDRTHRMLEEGLVEEVQTLLSEGIQSEAAGLDGLGYREVVAYLSGLLQFEELAAKIATNTRRYAKRQETWFRNQLAGAEVLSIDVTDGPKLLAEQIAELWEKRKGQCESA